MNERIGRGFLVLVVTACLLTNSCSRVRPVILIDEDLYYDIILIHFTEDEKTEIYQAISPLLSQPCRETFHGAGLRSPQEVLQETGVVFRPSMDLYIYSAKELGLTHERIRRSYADEFSSGRAQAGVVSPMLYGVRLTVDGRPHIFLPDTAFLGQSYLFGRLSLNDVLTHEFIHAAGQPPTPGWLLGDDLAGFEHYERILSACR